jgi:hypothetical protein
LNGGARLTVSLYGLDPAMADVERVVLASLPERWRITDEDADVAVIDGSHPNWPEALDRTLRRHPRGVVLANAHQADPDAVAAAADDAGTAAIPVAVGSPYLADPAFRAALPQLRTDRATSSLYASTIKWMADEGGRNLSAALLDQLAMVDAIVGPLDRLERSHRTASAYLAFGVGGDLAVSLLGASSINRAGHLELSLVGADQRWSVEFDASAISRPALITRYDDSGALTSDPLFEGGRRATWRELHAAILNGSELSYPLRVLAGTMRLATAILG